jgi:GNAT superfamily N-acetyltransferase
MLIIPGFIWLCITNWLIGVRKFQCTLAGNWGSRKQILCLADADAVIHPDYRRKGLLKTLTIHALEDMRKVPYEYHHFLKRKPEALLLLILRLGWTECRFFQTAYHLRCRKWLQT